MKSRSIRKRNINESDLESYLDSIDNSYQGF